MLSGGFISFLAGASLSPHPILSHQTLALAALGRQKFRHRMREVRRGTKVMSGFKEGRAAAAGSVGRAELSGGYSCASPFEEI